MAHPDDFSDLPKAAREEVARLAASGTLHPDHQVAASAWRWAQAADRTQGVGSLAGELISGILTPGSVDLRVLRRERRLARQLLALGEPQQP